MAGPCAVMVTAVLLGCGSTAPDLAAIPSSIPEDFDAVATDDSGVPGLDSIDPFCRAWSAFAGSFQVVAVAAAFSDGSDREIGVLEVVAAPVVVDAAEEFFATLPGELAAERELLADDYLGPFERRSREALDALVAAGATPADLDELAAIWTTVLAARDPDRPAPEIVLTDPLDALVEAAVALVMESRPPFRSDDRLASGARAPLTENYLALNCPDRGLLAGGDDIG